MRQHLRVSATLFVFIFLFLDFDSQLLAQSAPLTPQELDQLVSPIALYPDSLLSQIMTASTNPQEILDVDNYLSGSPGLSGTALTDAAQQQGFDPEFIALVNFPQVLNTMAQHIADYAAIGNAFIQDQGAVTDSIQRLRAQAFDAGTLRSNTQQTVQVQPGPGQTIYVIQPANPRVVYVPQYDPTVVYVRPSGPSLAAPLIAFGAGITLGALLVDQPWGWGGWSWNWGARHAYYHNAVWGGWGRPYRPPSRWYRPRPMVWTNRPGFGGNWNDRPPNYRLPRSGNRPGYGRPPYSLRNPKGYRPGPNRPVPGGSRRNLPPPSANPKRPTTPRPSRPSGPPSGGRPPSRGNPPSGGNRSTRPSNPRPSQKPRSYPPPKRTADRR